MKQIIVLVIAVITFHNTAILLAQSNEKDVYTSLRKTGIQSLRNHQYADALRQLEGAKILFDTEEIRQDIKQVNDSIDSLFNIAIASYKTTSKEAVQRAIVLFSELRDVRPKAYAYIAGCYSYLGDSILATDYYQKGISKGDALSALWYAMHLRKTDPQKSTSERIRLYKKATIYESSRDSLGTEYERINRIDSAYYWYARSSSRLSKYNRASLLLNPSYEKALGSIHDDPYKLLEESANLGDAQSAYYLGMLYRYRSTTKGDNDNILGWELIEKAAQLGHSKAKSWLRNKNDYVK